MLNSRICRIYRLIGNAEALVPYKRLDTLFEEYINPTINLINDLPEETFTQIKYDVGKDLSNVKKNLLHPAYYSKEGFLDPEVKKLFQSLDFLLEKIYPEHFGTD